MSKDRTPLKLLREWAEAHEAPDEPLLCAGKETWSPREIAQEAEEGSEMGKKFLEGFVENHLNREVS